MITLQVENYCQNCPDFKPYCSVLKANEICGNETVCETVYTLVQCTKKDRCKEIKAYIEQQMARKESNGQV